MVEPRKRFPAAIMVTTELLMLQPCEMLMNLQLLLNTCQQQSQTGHEKKIQMITSSD